MDCALGTSQIGKKRKRKQIHSRDVHGYGQPGIIRAGPPARVPRVAHVDVRRLLAAADGELERVLRPVRLLVGGRDVGAAGPRACDAGCVEDLVRVRAPARLAGHDEEVRAVDLEEAGGLVRAASCGGGCVRRGRRAKSSEENRYGLLRRDASFPTLPSLLIWLICTVLWSALDRRYHVASWRVRWTGQIIS